MRDGARSRIEVAAAVIHDTEGRFLLAQRPSGKAFEGYWEFPGGKVEPGESAADAMRRELHEELGIVVDSVYPWLTRDFEYPHASVRLRFFRIYHWHGEPHGREGQCFTWQRPRELTVAPMLPANGPILRALELPHRYGITRAEAVGEARFLDELEVALSRGLRLIQVREKAMSRSDLLRFAREVVSRARPFGARVLINSDVSVALEAQADGLHCTSAQLSQLASRPAIDWVAASCHAREDIQAATRMGADFVVLGPVMVTPTHADAPTLGWQGFTQHVQDAHIPVYALGGLRVEDLAAARAAGAHGVAMIRGAWAP
jgi:8-oxo-dGTP diphosphatase